MQWVKKSLHPYIFKKLYTPMSLIENTSQETRGVKGSLANTQIGIRNRTQNTLDFIWLTIFELS